MQLGRFTRLTNAVSKKLANLRAAIALHFAHYNFCRLHQSRRITPAMAAGIAERVWELRELVKLNVEVPRELPERPANVEFSSIRELYLQFEEIFLAGTRSLIVSVCGHRINCFEHHFFHMAGILVDGIEELSMPTEKPTILATTAGFGHYQIIEGGARGRHLRSAYGTLISPDEVWEGNPKFKKAKWGYIKEYRPKRARTSHAHFRSPWLAI